MGIVIEPAETLDKSRLESTVGPSIGFGNYIEATGEWSVSVLLAVLTDDPNELSAMYLAYTVSNGPTRDVKGDILLQRDGWSVLRFPVGATLTREPQVLKYNIACPGTPVTASITLPCRDQPWHLIGYSCHDPRQTDKVGTTCWDKVHTLHKSKPVHVLLGTGDQLYNDNVWDCSTLKQWLEIGVESVKINTAPTQEQINEVDDFYFFAYLRWLKNHPLGHQTIAGIPQMNTWDDHDIFDGWGSYPARLQNSAMFQMIFGSARRHFHAFQMHTAELRKETDGFFGGTGCSWIRHMGPGLAVAALDTRSERTRDRIIPMERMDQLAEKLAGLPDSVQHLLFVSAVPVAYPELAAVEKLLNCLGKAPSILSKTGLYGGLMNEFGEPELLDDIVDHWGSGPHKSEKKELLIRLKRLATRCKVRVTLLSGDVHQCTFCYVESSSPYVNGRKQPIAHALDPGFIPQIVSSAIGYGPPPDLIVKMLEYNSYVDPKPVTPAEPEEDSLTEVQGMLFKHIQPAGSKRFANCNNFVEVTLEPASGVLSDYSVLIFDLWVKAKELQDRTMTVFRIPIPPLIAPGKQDSNHAQLITAAPELQMDQFKPVPKTLAQKCGFCC